MRMILLDFRTVETIQELQKQLKEAMEFPGYYRGNLDACYDMLTEITEDICIEVWLPERQELAGYFKKLQRVLTDAQEENEHLTLIWRLEE